MKLLIEEVLKIQHKIHTSHIGDLPVTSFNPNHTCSVSLKDFVNSPFMRAVLQHKPDAMMSFCKFLEKVCDADFFSYVFKSSGGDTLRMINLLIIAAEKTRLAHRGRRDCYDKLKACMDSLHIDTKINTTTSAYHVKSRNSSKLDKKIFTWTIGVNIIYKELSCYLQLEHRKTCNKKLRDNANPGNSTQHISPTKLGEVNISGYYNTLLINFFNKNPHFLSTASRTDRVPYNSVPINKELLKALGNFTLSVDKINNYE